MNERDKKDIIHEHFSKNGKHAVSFLWKKMDEDARKSRMAAVTYARQLKNHGKEKADEWLYARFGAEAETMLSKPLFRRQYIKYL